MPWVRCAFGNVSFWKSPTLNTTLESQKHNKYLYLLWIIDEFCFSCHIFQEYSICCGKAVENLVWCPPFPTMDWRRPKLLRQAIRLLRASLDRGGPLLLLTLIWSSYHRKWYRSISAWAAAQGSWSAEHRNPDHWTRDNQTSVLWCKPQFNFNPSRGGTYLTKINFSKFYPQFLMVLYVS